MTYKIRYDHPSQKTSYYLDSVVPGGYRFTCGETAENVCRNLNAELTLTCGNFGKYTVEPINGKT